MVAAELAREGRASAISGTLNGAHKIVGGEFIVGLNDETLIEGAQLDGNKLHARIEGEPYDVEFRWKLGASVMHLKDASGKFAVQIARQQGSYRLNHGGNMVIATVRRPRMAALAALMPVKLPPDTSKFLICPMPGLVVSINVAAGQEVKVGETLAIVEAMKMENVLKAERDGTVKKINAAKGDSLALDDVILEFA